MKAIHHEQRISVKRKPIQASLLFILVLMAIGSVFGQQQQSKDRVFQTSTEQPHETITLQPETINWVSFPRLDRAVDEPYDSETLFNATIPDPSNFFEARHNEGGVIIDKTYSEGEFYLQLCVVEDSIVGNQSNNDPTVGTTPLIENYVHRHVLRATVNGINGELVSDGDVVMTGNTFTKTYEIAVDGVWKTQHLSVVAWVFRGSDFEVLQAEEVHVKED